MLLKNKTPKCYKHSTLVRHRQNLKVESILGLLDPKARVLTIRQPSWPNPHVTGMHLCLKEH